MKLIFSAAAAWLCAVRLFLRSRIKRRHLRDEKIRRDPALSGMPSAGTSVLRNGRRCFFRSGLCGVASAIAWRPR